MLAWNAQPKFIVYGINFFRTRLVKRVCSKKPYLTHGLPKISKSDWKNSKIKSTNRNPLRLFIYQKTIQKIIGLPVIRLSNWASHHRAMQNYHLFAKLLHTQNSAGHIIFTVARSLRNLPFRPMKIVQYIWNQLKFVIAIWNFFFNTHNKKYYKSYQNFTDKII